MGALLPPERQEEYHRQSSAATTKSTLPKQGRDDLEAFSKQTSFLALMLKNVLNHPALFGPGSQRCQRCIQPLGHGCSWEWFWGWLTAPCPPPLSARAGKRLHTPSQDRAGDLQRVRLTS